MDVLESLAAAAGLQPRSGPRYDWVAVERSLDGLRLPVGYKRLVDGFTLGRFGGVVTVIRPGFPEGAEDEYPGYYRRLLDDLRGDRKIGYGSWPYPLHPETGGLLPWGDTPTGQLIFWLTEGDDPDAWPIVWTDEGYEEWQLRRQSVPEFLLELITDPSGVPGIAADGSAPIGFVGAEHDDPEDESAALLEALGTALKAEPDQDWTVRAAQWGFQFPADYRAFHDALGPGVFCDIGIFGPDAPEGWNLTELLQAGRQAVQAAGLDYLRFHPDTGGLIPWGMTQDGWLLGWLPQDPDPDLWCVAALGPGFMRIDWPELSFSEFLLFHAGIHEGYEVSLGNRPPWNGPPVFQGLSG
jgi:hypothetical protein